MAKQKSPARDIEVPRWKKPMKKVDFHLPVAENNQTDTLKLEVALRERIKELNCLYGIAQLAERYHDSIGDFLQNLANLLPTSWQYPEVTCARVQLDGRTYRSSIFRVSKWRQTSEISVYNESAGQVEVFYTEERPAEDEGPFLKEERILLDTVAGQIGKIAMRMASEKELKELNTQLAVERKALQETNAALRAVLARIEEEKKGINTNVRANVEKIVMPILHTFALELPEYQRKYIDILRTHLEAITSPFVNQLSRRFYALTPSEIKICNMIRNGMRTKEIARMNSVSEATVNRHREHIRRKLGIANQEINLTTYLQSSMWEEM